MNSGRIKIVQKFHIFIASKGAGLSLDIRRSRKNLKSLLQNIYLMLQLIYHKHNPLITNIVYGSIFFSKNHLALDRKNSEEDNIFAWVL